MNLRLQQKTCLVFHRRSYQAHTLLEESAKIVPLGVQQLVTGAVPLMGLLCTPKWFIEVNILKY